MALLGKKSAPVEPFHVPALTSHPEYAALVAKRAELLARQANVRADLRELRRQIAETPAPALRPGVAELLDEPSGSTTALRAQLSELTTLDRDVDAALEVLRERLAVARSAASIAINNIVRPEYGKRVAAIAHALEAVAAARTQYDDLRDQFDRQDIAWGALGPVSLNFLGDSRDGHIQRFIREAREAGYVA